MQKSNLFLRVLSPLNLLSRKAGEGMLETLVEQCPTLGPEKFGNWEPIRTPYSLDAALDAWPACPDEGGNPFLWKRSRPSAEGSVWFANPAHPQHTSITAATWPMLASVDQFTRLMRAWATQARADLSFVHLLVPEEIERGVASGAVDHLDSGRTLFNLFVTTHELRRALPDVYWCTIFGPAYVAHFGRDRLMTSPAPIVQEVGEEPILVQLSDSPFDFKTDYAGITAVRDSVVEHLGKASFTPGEGSVPEFEFGGELEVNARAP